MIKPHLRSNVKQMLGDDFSELLHEISPFVEPRMDIYKSNQNFILAMELAGAKKEDISVKRMDRTLIIEGHINQDYMDDKIKVISSERFYGFFRREVSIPEECHVEQLQAIFERGILFITIPFFKK
ncbi:Hsp20/alpha crystallin family protein [Neobacillus niacini]|uniref:Hsp20/alpha crystallin family protein n=1 Tax=Neobacillus niacini TaxID=86668 RepID=UPI0021CB130E|nr:Hsp20/alpha crystallin family protein [Neobacillus niacini]MCM3768481.1 Hsp20/alpha crystallin family protein [Neobacillus niacini]